MSRIDSNGTLALDTCITKNENDLMPCPSLDPYSFWTRPKIFGLEQKKQNSVEKLIPDQNVLDLYMYRAYEVD